MRNFPKSVQNKIKQAIFILHEVAFNLEIGSEAEEKAKEYIFRYFESNPFSRVDPRTIIAVLVHHSALDSGEYRSQMQIALALKVNRAWVQRKRRDILDHCGIEVYQHNSANE
ncbi:MAG: cyclin family protein [Candidatus Hodarchaeota archaeon]